MTTPYAQPTTPAENLVRGALFALIAIPAGVIVFDILWNIGFIASIVTYGTAVLAVWLYRKGAGGIMTRNGVWVIVGILVVTVVLSFIVALLSEFTLAVVKETGLSPTAVLANPDFGRVFNLALPELLKSDALYFGLAILFAGLGAFRTIRRAFQFSRLHDAAPADGVYPTTATDVTPASAVPTAATDGTPGGAPYVTPTAAPDADKPESGTAGPTFH